MLTYTKENWAAMQKEGVPLMHKHYAEITPWPDVKLDLDHEQFLMMEKAGQLAVFTARDDKGALRGYAVFTLYKHLHYNEVHAAQSGIFVEKSFRGDGVTFLKFCDELLRLKGVRVTYHGIPASQDKSKLFEQAGYNLLDKTYARRLQ